MYKICKLCGNSKPIVEFSRWKLSVDEHKHWCKTCTAIKRRQDRLFKGLKVRIDRSAETENLKICTNCLELKPRSQFSTSSFCTKCKVISNRVRTGSKEKAIPIVNSTSKECLKCHNILHIDLFTNNKRGRLGKVSYCKKCSLELNRNVDKNIKRGRSRKYWYKDLDYSRSLHRVRQAKRKYVLQTFRDPKVTSKVINTLFKLSKTCYYCDVELTKANRTLEHILPISRGGRHVIGNLAACCKSCNFSKGGKTKVEFLKYIKCINVKS